MLVFVFDHLFLIMTKANYLSYGWLEMLGLEMLLPTVAHSGFGIVGLGWLTGSESPLKGVYFPPLSLCAIYSFCKWWFLPSGLLSRHLEQVPCCPSPLYHGICFTWLVLSCDSVWDFYCLRRCNMRGSSEGPGQVASSSYDSFLDLRNERNRLDNMQVHIHF